MAVGESANFPLGDVGVITRHKINAHAVHLDEGEVAAFIESARIGGCLW